MYTHTVNDVRDDARRTTHDARRTRTLRLIKIVLTEDNLMKQVWWRTLDDGVNGVVERNGGLITKTKDY